jgi:hypothetical protein
MNKWQIGPVKLANGEEAFVDAINGGQEDWRYTGRARNHAGHWIACGWHANGRFMFARKDHECNLAPPPKKTVRVQACINVDATGVFTYYLARKDADRLASPNRIACIEIDREVTEGEGL